MTKKKVKIPIQQGFSASLPKLGLVMKAKLETKLKEFEESNINENLIQKASEYYLTLPSEELSLNTKKELIRSVVKEIRVTRDKKVDIYTL